MNSGAGGPNEEKPGVTDAQSSNEIRVTSNYMFSIFAISISCLLHVFFEISMSMSFV